MLASRPATTAHRPLALDAPRPGRDRSAHNLEHSIANAGLPNIVLVGACPAEGAALTRLMRRVDVIVCFTSAAEHVRGLAGPAVQVLIDDRALDPRAIEMLAAILVGHNGGRAAAVPPAPRSAPSPGSIKRVRDPDRGAATSRR